MTDAGQFRSNAPWRHAFDAARDPYTARNALGIIDITGGGGATPGGSDTQVQYNNSGTFGGASNLTWNNGASSLTLMGQLGIGVAPDASYPLLVHGETNGNLAITGYSGVDSGGEGVQLRSLDDTLTSNRVFEFIGTGYVFGSGGGVIIQSTNATAGPGSGALVVAGDAGIAGVVNMARADIRGSASGLVSIATQSAAGTYNFNLPTTAGTAGQVLTSAGGASSAMTWSNASAGSPTDAEYITAATSAGLSAERVLTDTATVTWDFATAGQAKASTTFSLPVWVELTQAAYDALSPPDPDTLYIVVG